ncbi:hypothetical protein FGO68_gene15872 [Halteria grandinella]|uniref:Right handed beta helix domain-containing protein n=1 Tax=Halteria grandinella TaxID=5974 RepID=A0A8J8P8R0_HALGN|nr:hypothetical protein FGO68_gene15872 [Halteria grandinella]
MSSLVGFPIEKEGFEVSNYHITIKDSTFTRFSSCGSILQNHYANDFALYPPIGVRSQWQKPQYLYFPIHYQKSANLYLEQRFLRQKLKQASSSASPITLFNTGAFERELYLINNTFTRFNYLKVAHLFNEWGMDFNVVPLVANESNKDIGYVVSLYGSFDNSLLSVEGNNFNDTFVQGQCQYGVPRYDFSANFQNILSYSETDPYMQLTHMITAMNLSNSLVILRGNEFKNISITGSIINLGERDMSFSSPFIIARNTFEMILNNYNTNAIHIIRENSGTMSDSAIHDLTNAGLSYQDDFRIRNSLRGGSILIVQNNFTQMQGCFGINNGQIHVGVRYQRDTQADLLARGQVAVISQSLFPSAISADFSGSYIESKLFKDLRLEHKELREYYIGRLSVNITGNMYINTSMGPTGVEDSLFLGSLISFINVPTILISNEVFINVGQFSVAYAKYLFQQINGIELYYEPPLISRWDGYYVPYWLEMFLSTSLFVVKGSTCFNLTGSNYFENVWLFDKQSSLMRTKQQGLILYLEQFNGQVKIGSDKKEERTAIKDILGYLNDRNLYSIQFGYAPRLVELSLADLAIYGAGSVLFHIHHSSNKYSSVTFQNVDIDNAFFTADYFHLTRQVSAPDRAPSIFTTFLNDETYQNIPVSLKITNFTMKNVQFDGGSCHLQLIAQNIEIDGLVMQDFGKKKYTGSDAKIVSVEDRYRQKRNINVPVSLVQLWLYDIKGQRQSDVIVKRSTFKNIDTINGALPVFAIDKVFTFDTYVKSVVRLDQITFQDEASSIDTTTEFIPGGSLFKISTDSETNIFIYLSSSKIEGTFSKCKINLDQPECIDGIMEVSQYTTLKLFEVESSLIEDNKGMTANVLYTPQNSVQQVVFKSTRIIGNKVRSHLSQNIILMASEELSLFTYPSLFKLMNMPNITFHNCDISDQQFAQEGAFMSLNSNSTMHLINSRVSDLSAQQAGAISVDTKSSLNVVNSRFSQNKAIAQGVLSLNVESKLTISNSVFTKNMAVEDGVFKLTGDSSFVIKDSEFSQNQAELKNSIGTIIQINLESSIIGSKFVSNIAYISKPDPNINHIGKLIEFISISSSFVIQDCEFSNNVAYSGTPNLFFFDTSNVTITNSKFSNGLAPSTMIIQDSTIEGNYIQVISHSIIFIRECSFINGLAGIGGALYVQGESTVSIADSFFKENYATRQGGAIFADSFQSIIIADGTVFINNQGNLVGGDALYLKNAPSGEVMISDTLFFSNAFDSNFIYSQDILRLEMTGVQANVSQQNISRLLEKGGGFLLNNIETLSISHSSFTSIRGTSSTGGGAVVIAYNTKSTQNPVSITNTAFLNSTSIYRGGALTLIDVEQTHIEKVTFQENSASKIGGALMYSCNHLVGISRVCELVIKDSSFYKNKAGIEGGAVKLDFYEAIFQNVSFQNNSAGVYGDDIGSVAHQLIKISQSDVGKKSFSKSRLLQSADPISSGGAISLYFGLVDKYGTFVQVDSKSKLYIQQQSAQQLRYRTIKKDIATQFPPIIETTTSYMAENGFFKVEGLVFVATPNSTQCKYSNLNQTLKP